jgi:hypothetical protein
MQTHTHTLKTRHDTRHTKVPENNDVAPMKAVPSAAGQHPVVLLQSGVHRLALSVGGVRRVGGHCASTRGRSEWSGGYLNAVCPIGEGVGEHVAKAVPHTHAEAGLHPQLATISGD